MQKTSVYLKIQFEKELNLLEYWETWDRSESVCSTTPPGQLSAANRLWISTRPLKTRRRLSNKPATPINQSAKASWRKGLTSAFVYFL